MSRIPAGLRSMVSHTAVVAATVLGVAALEPASPAYATSSAPIVASRVVDHRYIEVNGEPFTSMAVQFRIDRASAHGDPKPW